jgi:hypothetical protein
MNIPQINFNILTETGTFKDIYHQVFHKKLILFDRRYFKAVNINHVHFLKVNKKQTVILLLFLGAFVLI